MRDILKSIRLDHAIMKSRYPMFTIGYVIGVFYGVISKTPFFAALIVMVMSAPLAGQYFAMYEKYNLGQLYGMLPLRKSEVVIGRYLYTLCIVIINGVAATLLAYFVSIMTGSRTNSLESVNFLSAGFLYFCLAIAVTFPLYFKFSYSKVYVVSSIPVYVIFIAILAAMRKTKALQPNSPVVQYLTTHATTAAIGCGLGLVLLALSCVLSRALVGGKRSKARGHVGKAQR